MKIKVIKGKIGDMGIGKTIDVSDEDGERLIRLGYGEKAVGKTNPAPTPPDGGKDKK